MRASTILTVLLSTLAIAGPIERRFGTDDVVVYPDEKLYNEEYKRAPVIVATEADDSVVYPDEKLYNEEYKRHTADESVVYPDKKLYDEEYKRHTAEADDSIVYPDEKLYNEDPTELIQSPFTKVSPRIFNPKLNLYASNPFEPVAITFKSNRTYLERPSPENDKLWEGLYPKDHHGLFEWPEDKPERSGFAGFHQLHCVQDALRKRFYQEEDLKKALIAGEDVDNMPQHIDETHVLHCVEFLRQSVMCHADTSLQVEASYHQGILAFGTTYPCRNWWQMVDWVNERNAKE
ncbi:hypothetical protein BELL_0894g00020 [Botrytis elliptica]|uniref:Uncharacterized protein n=1 Tax=Botrytis elliptica TaxID=278938 RepID=A0A4Z1J187_9HELO|nr:hypothetical protein BELL_0894g00020 [Botrytis elliptica]